MKCFKVRSCSLKTFKVKHAIAYFHISDHLQLTMKSFHVLFPSISLFKKNNKAHSNYKSSQFSFTTFPLFEHKNARFKIKKLKKEKVAGSLAFYFRKLNLKRQTRVVFLFFYERQWLLNAFVHWGYLVARVSREGWALHVNFPRFPPSADRPYRLFCPAYAV